MDLGNAYGHDGDWPMAFACFRKVVEAGNATESEWLWATGSALGAGETNACVQLCRQMLDQFGQQDNPVAAERCAKQCLSLPALPADLLERAADRADFSFAANPNYRWRQLAKGMAEYRRGNWSETLTALRQPERTGEIEISVQAVAFSAMARHQLGDSDGARKALAEVNRRLQFMVRTGELGNPRNKTWDNCARAVAERAEAERLILGRPVSAPTDVPDRRTCLPRICASVVFGSAENMRTIRNAKSFVRSRKSVSSFCILPSVFHRRNRPISRLTSSWTSCCMVGRLAGAHAERKKAEG